MILSEGLGTESYLETGNRGTFENSVVRSMRPHFAGGIVICGGKTWEHDASAPLTTDRETVEAVWNRLARRADEEKIGTDAKASTETMTDPDIRLVANDGREIRPVRQTGNVYCFMVPSTVADVHIATRTSRPSEIIGPFCDDRRHLGVVVGEIVVTNGRERRALDSHLSDDALTGWQAYEGGVGRWTAGNAKLSLGETSEGLFARMVEIEVLAAGPYLIETTPSDDIQVA